MQLYHKTDQAQAPKSTKKPQDEQFSFYKGEWRYRDDCEGKKRQCREGE
jgi:hypothetical protein